MRAAPSLKWFVDAVVFAAVGGASRAQMAAMAERAGPRLLAIVERTAADLGLTARVMPEPHQTRIEIDGERPLVAFYLSHCELAHLDSGFLGDEYVAERIKHSVASARRAA